MQSTDQQQNNEKAWKSCAMRMLGGLALFVVAFAIYGPTLSYEMIYDDSASIIDNDSIRHLFPLFGLPGENGPLKPQVDTPLTARPMVNLTFAINYYFSELDPVGYRLTHVIAHAIVAIILWAIVSATLRQPLFQHRFDQKSQMLGLVSALIWMLHPMHSETIVYLTQRTELQMGLFYALTMLLSIYFWASTRRIGKLFWCTAAVASSGCGMLSKEMMASIPAMVFFYEWTFIGGSIWCQLKRSWLLYCGLMLSWLPIIAIYVSGEGTPTAGFHNSISAHDFWLTQASSFFTYWRLAFVPWPLSLHYHVAIQSTFAEAWPGVIALGLYLLVCAFSVWRRTSLGYMMLWFFGVLSPTLIVPLPHEEISERRLYVTLMAAIPFFVVVGFEAVKWIDAKMATLRQNGNAIGPTRMRVPPSKLLGAGLISGVTIAFFLICTFTLPRLQHRADLWIHVLKHQPYNTFALCSQGVEDCNQGNFGVGLEKIQAAYDTDPGFAFFSRSLAETLDTMHEHKRMLIVCQKMYEMFPKQVAWVYAFAVALERNEMLSEAMAKYRETIELSPSSWRAHSALATLLAEHDRLDESIKHFEIATELHPDFVNCMNLMTMYLNSWQEEKALMVGKQLLQAARKEKSKEEVEQIQLSLEELASSIRTLPGR
jgi:protein O-mannosyl-transferase